jgi:hypothetical protein
MSFLKGVVIGETDVTMTDRCKNLHGNNLNISKLVIDPY